METKYHIPVWSKGWMRWAAALKIAGATDSQKKKVLGEHYKEYTLRDIHHWND